MQVAAYPDETFSGTVSTIAPTIDPIVDGVRHGERRTRTRLALSRPPECQLRLRERAEHGQSPPQEPDLFRDRGRLLE